MELFYDLIYVVAISIAAHVLAEAHGGHIPADALLKFPLIFVPLWWAWTGFTLYVNRFGEDSPAQRIVYFIQMLFVIIMAANINVDFEAYYLFFMIGYVGIRLSTVYMYARVWNRHLGLPRQVARYLCLSFLIGSAISFSSVLFPGVAKFYVLYLGIVVDIALPLAGRRLLRRMPVHHHHLMERYGLATIILLGELILVMVDTIRHHSLTLQSGWAVLIGFSIAVAIWWHYFESSERRPMRTGPARAIRSFTATCLRSCRSVSSPMSSGTPLITSSLCVPLLGWPGAASPCMCFPPFLSFVLMRRQKACSLGPGWAIL
ncbi:low temperature requirement protein A [Paenibacillus sp. CC-CFT747]|nr:low temperature requirement protein A [Paenibacillus sp. CC-CFT747]